MNRSSSRRGRTLFLTAGLHAFTHIFQMALIPLYLPIQKFYGRDSVDDATLLVTVMLIVLSVSAILSLVQKRLLRWQSTETQGAQAVGA